MSLDHKRCPAGNLPLWCHKQQALILSDYCVCIYTANNKLIDKIKKNFASMAAEGSSGGKAPPKKVAVVGAGLVGSLEACMMAKRGYDVHLYELRDDIRTMEHVPGRSINLAMSLRSRTGLRAVGVEDQIIDDHGITMKARMIHGTNGSLKTIPYNKDGKCIYSVGRRHVNEVLLSRAEVFPNVTIHFKHKLINVDLESGKMKFQKTDTKEIVTDEADLVIGCDGAFSAVRSHMLKRPQFNYKQEYIPHGYMELCIPATCDGKFALPINYLHIWPRDEYMMIALPNQDCSWTVTLFMPFEIFDSLKTPKILLSFFEKNYPDAVDLIGKEKLIQDFFSNKALPLISVKCSPYHVGSSALLLGDAAHAMVPFYGQGMNCGMEDCVVLDGFIDQCEGDFSKLLPLYSFYRNPDAEAIVDLAMYNYLEMRHLVNSKLFLMRKMWDNFLYTLFPNRWIPLYTMVTFTRERYHMCILKKKWQDKIIRRLLYLAGMATIATGFFIMKKNAVLFQPAVRTVSEKAVAFAVGVQKMYQ